MACKPKVAKKPPRRHGSSNGSCPDEPETGTAFFESEGPLRSLLYMNELRQEDKLCDAQLRVSGGKEYSAHRLVLAASSSYFADVYCGHTVFAADEVLELSRDAVDEETIEMLLEFAYTKKVKIGQGNVHRLFNSADCLRFPGLKEACFRYLLRTLDTDNCLGMWTFASAHTGDRGGLEEAALELVKKNFKDVVLSSSFADLGLDGLMALLNNDDLVVEKEEQVYEAAMTWLEHDAEGRKEHIGRVMSCVRMPLMDLDYLMGTVQDDPLIRSDQKALDELIKAIDFKQKELEGGRSPKSALLTLSVDENEVPVEPRRPSLRLEEVQIIKSKADRLGLCIMGGLDRPGHVFKKGDRPGCLITGILPSGAAANTAIRAGDRIISVNGHNLESLTHEQAVAMLAKSREILTLVVRHDDPPAGLKEFTLKTDRGEGFGFSIGGGLNSPPANPENESDDSIFVTRVLTGGAADKSGHLRVGQKILQVNSISMHGTTHAEALQATRQSVDRLTLMVCDGFNADGYVAPLDLIGTEKDKQLHKLISRKSMIFDPSAYVSY
ncbi:kelch-like protein 3 [Sycon ciliatum]|uniref:kelch-like protein 3 n=1 Tax=Sycon ciliatum TaxID=27933 RepID=UPI0020AD5DF6|eukprot:scpid38747/ scgid26946/ Kelch-like protein 17; Actinfilin